MPEDVIAVNDSARCRRGTASVEAPGVGQPV